MVNFESFFLLHLFYKQLKNLNEPLKSLAQKTPSIKNTGGFYLVEVFHNWVPVNFITKLLCPVLMSRALAPVMFTLLSSFWFPTCTLFMYIYTLSYVSGSRLSLSILLSNNYASIKKWLIIRKNYKKIGLL